MIKSMTGFGRSEIASGNRKIMVEMNKGCYKKICFER